MLANVGDFKTFVEILKPNPYKIIATISCAWISNPFLNGFG